MQTSSPFPQPAPWESLPIDVEIRQLPDIRLEVAAAGPTGGFPIILLHGFPDLWHGWHHQIGNLSHAGFRVLAPNQRGYGQSEKPKGVTAYDIDRLATDVIDLADTESEAPFYLVGHDWGGLVAWWVASCWPERVKRLVILNAPHPGIFLPYLLRHPTQVIRSWYIGFFQIPLVPETLLGIRNFTLLSRLLDWGDHAKVFDDHDRCSLREGWAEKGALTAMINYYRAAARRTARSLRRRISVPTRIVFGRQAPYEHSGLAKASAELCDDASIRWLEEAGHWIQREEPQIVTEEILQFCSK